MKKVFLCSFLILISFVLAFGLSGVAHAIPCGVGGVSGSIDCAI